MKFISNLKMTVKKLPLFCSCVAAMTLSMSAKTMAGTLYDVTDLGTLQGGNSSYATGINNLGQVVGYSSTNNGDRAFLWSSSSGISNLGSLSYIQSAFVPYPNATVENIYNTYTNSYANGINDLGQVVGYSSNTSGYHNSEYNYPLSSNERAFLWSSSSGMTDLNTLIYGNPNPQPYYSSSDFFSKFPMYTDATAINNAGQVVGTLYLPNGDSHLIFPSDPYRAFSWSPSSGTANNNIGSLITDAFSSYASGVNNAGEVVVNLTGHFDSTPYLVSSNQHTVTQVALPPRSIDRFQDFSFGTGINDAGQIVGYSFSDNYNAFYYTTIVRHAFISNSTSSIDIGTLPSGLNSYANGINNSAQVVGYADSSDGIHAFLWSSNSGITDLNTLLDPSSGLGWILDSATAINNQGQIVGDGIYNGQARAFLLTPESTTPVPEPGTIGGTVLTGVWLFYLRRRQRCLQGLSS